MKRAPEVLTAHGALAEAQGRTAIAEREYRAALDSAPGDPEALERLVDLLLRSQAPGDAAALTARLAKTYRSSPLHLSLAGEVALAEKRYADAERYLEAARRLTPEATSVRVELARARLLAGRPADALEPLAGLAPSPDVEMLRGAALAARERLGWRAWGIRAGAGSRWADARLCSTRLATHNSGRAARPTR